MTESSHPLFYGFCLSFFYLCGCFTYMYKMKKTILIIITLCCMLPAISFAQRGSVSNVRTDFSSKDYVDTMATMVWTGVNMSGQLPLGLLREWFTPNLAVGTGVNIKTNHNWTFDVCFNYMFQSSLRDTTAPFLGDMVDDYGRIMDGNGRTALGVSFEGRYCYVGAGIGKVIPVNRWKNSGIWLRYSMGYFTHKIRINDYDHQVPQLDGDYLKGYDHRSGGFAMSQFVGYLFIQKNRLLNFYGGIEFFESWTKPNRNYIFNEGSTANAKYKFSGLIGLKIGWNIPLYEKKSVTTFYYK